MVPQGRRITVLGGGVIGLTVAVSLRLAGYRVRMVSQAWADRPEGAGRDPRFTSLYPAASIAPHKVQLPDLEGCLRESQRAFEQFLEWNGWGIRRETHWEVYENPVELPAYAAQFQDLKLLPSDGSGLPGCPRRRSDLSVYGWVYSGLFADFPLYIRQLGRLADSLGVERRDQTVTTYFEDATKPRLVINCLGSGALDVFADPQDSKWIRGHLIFGGPGGSPWSYRQGRRFSYNYTPDPQIYPTESGGGGSLYFYPRRDSWVLGGSTQIGPRTQDGIWAGEETVGETMEINGIEVPEEIFSLNRGLILELTGVDIGDYSLDAAVGYRFARDLEGEGARLEPDPERADRLFHAYGFGGGGVTLSWGAARRVIDWVRQRQRPLEDIVDPGETLCRALRGCLLRG